MSFCVYFFKIDEITSTSPLKYKVIFFEETKRYSIIGQGQLTEFAVGMKLHVIAEKLKSNEKLNDAAKAAMIDYLYVKRLSKL